MVVYEEHSFVLNETFKREYKQGTCCMCGQRCLEIAYAHSSCVIAMVFTLKKILKDKDVEMGKAINDRKINMED